MNLEEIGPSQREREITECASIFKDGATFSNNVGYVRKACQYLELPFPWDSAAVKNVVSALKLTAEGEFRFPNFIMGDTVARIIHGGKGAETSPIYHT